MPYCSSCGTELQATSAYCPNCGSKVNAPEVVSVTSQTISSSSTSPAPIVSTPVPFTFHIPSFVGGLLILIGFFSPWLNSDFLGLDVQELNGRLLLSICFDIVKGSGDGKYFFIIIMICLALLVIAGLACFCYSFIKGALSEKGFDDFKNVPIAALIVMTVLIVFAVKSILNDYNLSLPDDTANAIFKSMGRGILLTVAGALILAYSSPRSKKQ